MTTAKFFVQECVPVFNHSIDQQIDRTECRAIATFDDESTAFWAAAECNRAVEEDVDLDEHTPFYRAVDENGNHVFPVLETPPPLNDDDIPF